MQRHRKRWASRTAWALAVLLLFVASSALTGCPEQEQGNDSLLERDVEEDEDTDDEGPDYEAGILDGTWELRWQDGGEHFSDFIIEHNLDDETLVIEFDTVGDGTGQVTNVQFDEEADLGDGREPGRLSGEWRPHPDDLDSNERYTMSSTYFSADSTDVMQGEIDASVGFDFRLFVMERKDDSDD